MRCYTIVYTRKSSEEDDRQILSLDAQERECRTYAEQHEIAIDELIREAHSARKPGRPLFSAMLHRIERQRQKGVPVRVLCHKPDRLLRNLGDWARISELIDSGLECSFVTGSYPNNAQGKMAFGINVIFAKYYVDNLSEEVKKGMREKIERGEWPGPVPPGYRKIAGETVVDPETGPSLRRGFELFDTGEYSLATLSSRLYAEGVRGRYSGRKLAKSVVHEHILTNPFYCGLLRYKGSLYPGKHEPLIPVALFERVQARLRGKMRSRRRRHDFRYRGLLRCGRCNGAIVGEFQKGRYIYYRCSHYRGDCGERYLRQEVLDRVFQEQVARTVALPDWVVAKLLRLAEQLTLQNKAEEANGPATLQRRLDEIDRRLSVLVDLRLAGQILEAEYLAKRQQLTVEQAQIRERIASFELRPLNPQTTVRGFIRICNEFPSLLREGPDEEVRRLLRIVGSNYRLRAGMVDFEPVEPFTIARQAQNRSRWRPGPDDILTLINWAEANKLEEQLDRAA